MLIVFFLLDPSTRWSEKVTSPKSRHGAPTFSKRCVNLTIDVTNLGKTEIYSKTGSQNPFLLLSGAPKTCLDQVRLGQKKFEKMGLTRSTRSGQNSGKTNSDQQMSVIFGLSGIDYPQKSWFRQEKMLCWIFSWANSDKWALWAGFWSSNGE